jgi:hypothetical protein
VHVAQRRAHRARPRHRLAAPAGVAERGEQGELLLEQRLVLVERVAEQRERLGERPAPEDHLGAPAREPVERGEALVDAHRVVGAEHRDRGAEADAAGARGDRGEHHLGGGHGEVVAVVLAHADEVEPHLVGEHGLVDEVAEDLRVRQQAAVGAGRDVAEGVEAELDGRRGGVAGHGGWRTGKGWTRPRGGTTLARARAEL